MKRYLQFDLNIIFCQLRKQLKEFYNENLALNKEIDEKDKAILELANFYEVTFNQITYLIY